MKKKDLLGLALIALLFSGLWLAARLTREQQDIRREAATPTGVGEVRLSPDSLSVGVGEEFPLDVYFNTGPNEAEAQAISSMAIRITYPYSGTTPELEVVGIEQNFTDLAPGDWAMPVKLSEAKNGMVSIDILAVNINVSGYKNHEDKKLATIMMRVNSMPAANPTVLNFDPSETIMTSKVDARDMLLIPTSEASISIPGAPPAKTGEIVVDPAISTGSVGEIIPVDIKFRTGTSEAEAQAISSMAIRLTYPYTGSYPDFDVVDAQGSPSSQVYTDAGIVSAGWDFPVKTVTRAGGKVIVDLAGVYAQIEGYSTSSLTTLATVYFKASSVPSPNPAVVSVDMGQTRMYTKQAPPTDILNTASGGEYTIEQLGNARILFNFKMQGVEGECSSRPAVFTITDSEITKGYSIITSSDTDGLFTPSEEIPVGLPIPLSGRTFSMSIKPEGYLNKSLGDIMVYPDGIAFSSRSDHVALVGDFDEPGTGGYNILNIVDIGQILAEYTQLSIPVTPETKKFDIDCSGDITIADVALVLVNYTDLTIRGD